MAEDSRRIREGDRVQTSDGLNWTVALAPMYAGGVAVLTHSSEPTIWEGMPGDPYSGVMVTPNVITIARVAVERDWGEETG